MNTDKIYEFLKTELHGVSPAQHMTLIKESDACFTLIKSAVTLRNLAIRMVADADSAEDLREECRELLKHRPMADLTPTIMAERLTRIAALPKSVHINDEGRIYMVRIDNPLGDGSVWCALDMTETFRKTLELCKKERAV